MIINKILSNEYELVLTFTDLSLYAEEKLKFFNSCVYKEMNKQIKFPLMIVLIILNLQKD
jgi:hypothetical protein